MTQNPTLQNIAENIIQNFTAPGLSLSELVGTIADQFSALSGGVEICAFSDHQNGLSVLRLGKKPTKDEGKKQTFNLPLEWNQWAEANGIGKQVTAVRLIVSGEISPEGDEFLCAVRELTENLNRTADKIQPAAIWGNRDKTQVKWGMVAAGEKSRRLLCDIELFADSRMPVLVIGETGCGKELVANALHTASRRKGRFFAVNCAAIPKELIESELFGHKKGAYTGATDSRDGYFQSANNGTLFLDEIGELSLDLQAKLLRVLQENKVRRVGSNIEEDVKVRVVAATNRNLAEMVRKGEFRADLYYRLHGLMLKLDPLRDRAEEIPQLVEFLLNKLSEELGQSISIDKAAMCRLQMHDFPGNVRELVNLLEAGAVYAQNGVIETRHLRINGEIDEVLVEETPNYEFSRESGFAEDFVSVEENLIRFSQGKTYDEVQEAFNRIIFKNALVENDGQIARAAASLGMERTTLSRQLKKLGIITTPKEELLPLNLNLHQNGSGSMRSSALAA